MPIWMWLAILAFIAAIVFWTILSKVRDDNGRTVSMTWIGHIAAGLAALCLFISSFTIISSGKVGVTKVFGVVNESSVLTEGFNVHAPWMVVDVRDVRFSDFSFAGTDDPSTGPNEGKLDVITVDETRLTVEATVPLRPSPEVMPYLVTRFTAGWQDLAYNRVRSATRTVAGQVAWQESIGQNRTGMSDSIGTYVEATMRRMLREADVPTGIAETGFTVGEIQLRSVLPDDQVLSAMAARASAEIERQTQAQLEQVAISRQRVLAAQGAGYAYLISAVMTGQPFADGDIVCEEVPEGAPEGTLPVCTLPAPNMPEGGISASDVQQVIGALAGFDVDAATAALLENVARAEGQVPLNLFVGGNAAAVPGARAPVTPSQ